MKKLNINIKTFALSLLVTGLAIGFSAFKNAEKNVVIRNGVAFASWNFSGTDIEDPGDYDSGTTYCGIVKETVCIVNAPTAAGGGIDLNAIVPGFTPTTTVLDRINAALATIPLTTNETVLSFREQ
ncbi:hypothetical protein [Pedobacter psychroterrae]|uniref:Uncharacterized protein n=1 Tax=Pedobacter psychroterrae TaxID=2530453 RepID=A0A4V2MLN4_9SPHI|nr:hypothetical protein [Pedobacter psychroterrae]TCD02727.1 hypothetical protein EZ437_01690 [Pedobacter psychroterrae]